MAAAGGGVSIVSRLIVDVRENAGGNFVAMLRALSTLQCGGRTIGTLEQPPPENGERAPRMRTYYVRDNGLGIPEACMPKMFSAFQRLHGDRAKGDGIGLALVRRVTERHGGTAWVESAEGVGSTFYVTLPEQPLRMT